MDWKSFFDFNFSDCLSWLFSIASIICALRIPNAIQKYKWNEDFKTQTEALNSEINKIRNGRTISCDKFVEMFNKAAEYFNTYSKYCDWDIKFRIKILNLKYTVLRFKHKSKKRAKIEKQELIILMDKYKSLIDIINKKVG